MSKQIKDKMSMFKKVFFILLVMDFVSLVMSGITLFSVFKDLSGYGKLMIVVASVIAATFVAVLLFEVLSKIFLLRSTLPEFSWSSGPKGYITVAKLLVLFNFGAAIVGVLSAGGDGATLLNQAYLYLQTLASVVEMITALLYLRTVKSFSDECLNSAEK